MGSVASQRFRSVLVVAVLFWHSHWERQLKLNLRPAVDTARRICS